MSGEKKVEELLRTQVPGLDIGKPLTQQLNSLAIFMVISKIEREFGIKFHSMELNDRLLSSFQNLSAAVDKKVSQKKA